MSNKKEAKNSAREQGKTIALNRSARHDYHLEARYEAGISLLGWELKSIRAGRLNMGDSYAMVKNGEIFLFGAQITPLISASTHVIADDRRTRKLLLHRAEIDTLVGKVEREGYTLIPTACYWKGNKVKLELALAKGKQAHDKRQASKDARLGAREAAHDAPAQQERLSRLRSRFGLNSGARGPILIVSVDLWFPFPGVSWLRRGSQSRLAHAEGATFLVNPVAKL